MNMSGEQRIAATRQRVWEALNDPEVLKQCIPGCQTLEKEADDRLRATVEVKIGPIGARFNGAVALTDLDPPNGYTIVGEGQGGTVGFAKGGAKVRLADDGAGGTLLSYDVDAQVGGRLAQLGGPIIDATAKQLAGKFFDQFGQVVGAPAQTAEPAAAGAPVGGVATAPAPAVSRPAAAAPAARPAAAGTRWPGRRAGSSPRPRRRHPRPAPRPARAGPDRRGRARCGSASPPGR
jgi:carbon monoxide dehydrogenase subunit G